MPKLGPVVLLSPLFSSGATAALAEEQKDPAPPRTHVRRQQSRRYVHATARSADSSNDATHTETLNVNSDEDTAFWGRQLGASSATGMTSGDDPSAKSLVGTYEDQFGTIVTIDKDSITISYECLEGYEDYAASTFVILPQYTEPLSDAPEGSMYVVAYNDKNENEAPDTGEYTRFDYVLETPDGALYYCEIDWGEQSVETAIADGLTELVLPPRTRTIWRADVTHIPGASCIRLVDHASLHVSSRLSSSKLVPVARPVHLWLKNEQNSKLNCSIQNARHSGQGRWSTFSNQDIAHSLAPSQLSSAITTPRPPMSALLSQLCSALLLLLPAAARCCSLA